MSQQAQNDFYPDDESMAMAYAAAVNAEVRDLFAAGADIVQLDEPYVQARPEAAKDYAVACIDRAVEGAKGPTVVHVCFGYGKHVANKPVGYAFLSELDACSADEISIECAQPRLKMDLLTSLPSKKTGPCRRAGPSRPDRGNTADRSRAHPRGSRIPTRGAHGGRPRLRHEVSSARRRLYQACEHGQGPGTLFERSFLGIATQHMVRSGRYYCCWRRHR